MTALRNVLTLCAAAGIVALMLINAPAASASALRLSSPAYINGGSIPARYTCSGAGVSPPLAWSGAPKETKSLVLILTDPDAPDPKAPKTTWVHWVLYDIPATVHKLGTGESENLPAGTRRGENSWHRADYGGPCPPIGRHRYVHTLYALDTVLPDLHHPDRAALKSAMQGHILAKATLTASYQKPGHGS